LLQTRVILFALLIGYFLLAVSKILGMPVGTSIMAMITTAAFLYTFGDLLDARAGKSNFIKKAFQNTAVFLLIFTCGEKAALIKS
jgi:hypothetical protein